MLPLHEGGVVMDKPPTFAGTELDDYKACRAFYNNWYIV